MWAFLLRRLLHAVFVTWGVVTVVFFLVRLTGDPTLFLQILVTGVRQHPFLHADQEHGFPFESFGGMDRG